MATSLEVSLSVTTALFLILFIVFLILYVDCKPCKTKTAAIVRTSALAACSEDDTSARVVAAYSAVDVRSPSVAPVTLKTAFATGSQRGGMYNIVLLVPSVTDVDTAYVQFGKFPCAWTWLTQPFLAANTEQDAVAPMMYVTETGTYQYSVTVAWEYTPPAGATGPALDVSTPLSLQLTTTADFTQLVPVSPPGVCATPVDPALDAQHMWGEMRPQEFFNASSTTATLSSLMKYLPVKKTWTTAPFYQTINGVIPFNTKTSPQELMAISFAAYADIKFKTGGGTIMPSIINFSLTRYAPMSA